MVHEERFAVGGPPFHPVLDRHARQRDRLAARHGIPVEALVRACDEDPLAVGRNAAPQRPIALRRDRSRLSSVERANVEARPPAGLARRTDDRLPVRQPVRALNDQTLTGQALRLAHAGRMRNEVGGAWSCPRDSQRPHSVRGQAKGPAVADPRGRGAVGLPDVDGITLPAAFAGFVEEKQRPIDR